jgi:hypothetical protein
MAYHEATGASLGAARERKRKAHHLEIHPTDAGFRVEHHARAGDEAPASYTYSTGEEVADHVRAVASIPGRVVRPKAEEVENKFGRAPEGAE